VGFFACIYVRIFTSLVGRVHLAVPLDVCFSLCTSQLSLLVKHNNFFCSNLVASVSFCFLFCFFFAFVLRGPLFTSSVGGFSPERGSVRLGPGRAPRSASSFLHVTRSPDRQAVSFVLQGLQHGFRLGFKPARRLNAAKQNKPSAFQNPHVIDDYLALEVSRCRVAGPFPSIPVPNLQVSSFGVIPKKGQPGKWQLIIDLSSPSGYSVNDGISADEF